MSLLAITSTNKQQVKFSLAVVIMFLLCCTVTDFTWAVTVNELIEPIKNLKAEIFSGWMTVVKICAAASGILMSAFRGSLVPFGIGAGLSAGIHLYDSYLTDVASGALI